MKANANFKMKKDIKRMLATAGADRARLLRPAMIDAQLASEIRPKIREKRQPGASND